MPEVPSHLRAVLVRLGVLAAGLAGIVGVASGAFGGTRVIEHFQPVLRELGLVSIFWDVNFGTVEKAFDQRGQLLDQAYVRRADKFLNELIWMAKVLRYGRENIPLN